MDELFRKCSVFFLFVNLCFAKPESAQRSGKDGGASESVALFTLELVTYSSGFSKTK